MSYDWIQASELSSYDFCARAWWLRRVLKVVPRNRTELAAGRQHHARHSRSLLRSLWLRRLALALLFAAVAVAAFQLLRV